MPADGRAVPPDPLSLLAFLPASLRRRTRIAAAVAREQLLELHTGYAMELVEHARSVVPPPRVMEIYSRLHHIGAQDAAMLRQRVFALIGREVLEPETKGSLSAREAEWEPAPTWLSVLRRRLQGRVHLELRDWIDWHTAGVEIELFEFHVIHATRCMDILTPFTSAARAVELYSQLLDVLSARREFLYFHVIHRAGPQAAASTSAAPRVVQSTERGGWGAHPLFVGENHG